MQPTKVRNVTEKNATKRKNTHTCKCHLLVSLFLPSQQRISLSAYQKLHQNDRKSNQNQLHIDIKKRPIRKDRSLLGSSNMWTCGQTLRDVLIVYMYVNIHHQTFPQSELSRDGQDRFPFLTCLGSNSLKVNRLFY